MKKESIERNCTECAYEHGTGTCYRVTAPHSSQWLNENGDCKEYIKRYSLRHLWGWCHDKRLYKKYLLD